MDYESLLLAYKNNEISLSAALKTLNGHIDMGYADIDIARESRTGMPEAIFCSGKTPEQIEGIVRAMCERGVKNILATRCSEESFAAVRRAAPEARYISEAKIAVVSEERIVKNSGVIVVVTAGTSDIGVAEEAAVTAEVYGNGVKRIYDVGVAGIHRLFSRLEDLRSAAVIIVVAGMEGALASVVGGLVSAPVIAVPTSVGYGVGAGGITALMAMLNSCSAGIGVVNIDNGYGAGCLAASINQLTRIQPDEK